MSVGAVVAFVLGGMIVFFGGWAFQHRNRKKDEIKEWMSDPQTVAKITGTVNKGSHNDYNGYSYRGEILIDGVWYKAESRDTFYGKRTCENDEEVTVAYRPIKENEVINGIMGAMVKTLTNENWEERKSRYHFKFMDAHKYDKEGTVVTGLFLVGFGTVIILMGVLACLGVM